MRCLRSVLYLLVVAGCLILRPAAARAAVLHSAAYGFSIEIPDDWQETRQKQENNFFYQYKGYGKNVDIRVNQVAAGTAIDAIAWESVAPYKEPKGTPSDSFKITEEGECVIGQEKAKYRVYKDIQNTEDIFGMMQLIYVVVKNNNLYSIQFTSNRADFDADRAGFLDIINSLKFFSPEAVTGEKKPGTPGMQIMRPGLDFEESGLTRRFLEEESSEAGGDLKKK